MALILHAGPGNKNACKALIAAEYSGVEISLTPNFQMGVSNKTPEFLKLNPIGKVPVLQTPKGPIFESNAIARYVARLKETSLLGTSLYESALIDQWIDFATNEIDTHILLWVRCLYGFAPYMPEAIEYSIAALKRALAVLNTYLSSNTYLVGHSVSLADIVMVCNLSAGYRRVLTKESFSEFPHVDRYFWTLVNQPQFKHLGEMKQIEVLPPPPDKPREKQQHPKKEKPQKAKEQQPQKVQEEPPKAEEPRKLDDDEEEKPKPKPKNPLDLLPPSSMILDEWKRLYSNTKANNFREVAIKGFWDMYDPEGYSLWFCDYKYNDENTVPFVTLNKVSGFLQRMDFIRKYAFAKICIIGASAPYKIKGVWLFRGKEIPQIVKDECYDLDLYDWSRVDISDPGQKERVNIYFEEPDEIDGEKLLEAKCFK